MKKYLPILALILFGLSTNAQNIDVLDGTVVTACTGTFYDDGGPGSDYSDDTTYSFTISPTGASRVILTINIFDVETQASCTYDNLKIYDGPNAAAPLIGTYCNSNLPPATITSTNGVLFIVWYADTNVEEAGFDIDWQGILTASAVITQELDCFGDTDGQLTAIASGTAPYTYLWGGGQTTQVISNRDNGSYSVTITDAGGCTGNASTTLSDPPLLSVTVDKTDMSCNADCDGFVEANASGGTGSYSYAWDYPVTGVSTFSSSPADPISDDNLPNDYYIAVSGLGNLNGVVYELQKICLDISHTTDSHLDIYCQSPTGALFTLSLDNGGNGDNYTNTCFDIDASVTISAGSAPFSNAAGYVPQGGISLNTFNNNQNPNGNWLLRIYDDAAGTAGTLNNWSISFNKYSNTTQSISNLCSGPYAVTVSDANGCTASASATVAEPAVVQATATVNSNVTCFGGSNGQATGSAVGGTAPYNYNWTGGNINQVASGLSAGTYTLTVTDSNGCTDTENATISQNPAVTANIGTSANVSCYGYTNGSATVTAGGGTGSFSYSWLPIGFAGSGTATYSSLVAGYYTVTVTDGTGCTATDDITITQNTAVTASISASTNVLCNGAGTGSATVTAGGGNGTYTYDWSPNGFTGDATSTYSALTAGTYTVTVFDGLGCNKSVSVAITQPTALTANAVVDNNVTCNGLADGQASVSGTGGTGAYSYNWSPGGYTGATTNTYSDLPPNTYNVTVTDGNGCTAGDNVVITQNSAVGATVAVVNHVSCSGGNNGTAVATPSGGTGTYTYIWSDPAPAQTTVAADNLFAGNYTVSVYDGNGCFATASVTINEPSAVTANIPVYTNVSCNGGNNGSMTVTPGGGTPSYIYNWSNSANTASISGLTAGTYSVTVYDSFGCSAGATRTIYQNPPVTASASVVSNALCFGSSNGVVTVIPNGGTGTYNYLWQGGATTATASGFAAGTYTVTVTDGNGCTANSSATVTQPAAVSITASSVQTTCNGGSDGSITVTASNGTFPYLYSFDGTNYQTSNVITGLSANTYTVYVKDNHGCTASQSGVVVTEPALIPVSISVTMPNTYQLDELPDDLTSYGIPAGGTFTGPGVIVFDQTFDPEVAGVGGPYTITYTYTDGNGCTNSATKQVSVVESGASITGLNPDYCIYNPQVTITGVPDTITIPVVYSFTGDGITTTSNNQAIFKPGGAGGAGVGLHTITYTYTDPYLSQVFSVDQTVYIDSVGQVDFITLLPNYCEDDVTIYSLNAVDLFPSGGAGSWSISPSSTGFSGSGNYATISPQFINPGIYSVTYRYTTTYGCFDEEVQNFEISSLPVVDFTIRDIYNRVEPPATLTGTPPGGTFSGTGIIGDEFYPNLATIGTNLITYSYTHPVTGCTNTATNPTIVQIADGSIDGVNALNQYCWDGIADTLVGNPSNSNGDPGIFSMTGPGLTPIGDDSVVFDPVVAGPGNHTITYTYTGTDDVVQFDLNTTLNVDFINPVSFIGLDTSYCVTDEDVVLTGVPPESGNGLFYGVAPAALFSAGHSAIFKPSQLAPGIYFITYEFTASTGCKRDTTMQVTIYPLPVLSFDLRTTYSLVEPPYELHGTPAGGTFSGNGIAGNFFYPNIAGLGNHEIIYSYTNENFCQTTDTMYTDVIEAQGIIDGIDAGNQYCFNGMVDTLIGIAFNSDGSPGHFDGDGIDSVGIDTVLFDPSAVTPGYHNITFSFKDPSGTNLSITETVYVDYINPVSIIGLNPQYCINNPDEELLGYPSNGVFSGIGISGSNFDPAIVPPGNSSVTYTVTSVMGCTRDTTVFIEVFDIPAVSFSVDSQFCSNSSPVEIIGVPANGYFSGPNLSGTDTVTFTPNSSVVGTHEISYTYTDPVTGCSNTLIDVISVDLVENLSISTIDPGYCINNDSVLITGLVGGTADGVGSFFGAGIYDAGLNDGEAYFHPEIAGVGGPYNIQFTNTDANGCVNNYFTDLYVYDLPNVSIINLADGYCEDASDVTISGFPENANGSFTYTGGPGLFDLGDGTATFSPSDGTPVDTVYYTYVDGNNCVNSTWQIVNIYSLPVADFEIGDACIIDSISFSDLSVSEDVIETWYWNFGDIGSPENISNLQNPKHFYYSEGDKYVSLTVTTVSGCIDTYNMEITLGSKPFIDFDWTNECFDPAAPTATQFVNLSSDTSNISWDFGDGYISDDVNPSHTYSDAITYNVTLIVETPNQCVDTLTKEVAIRPYVTLFPYFQDFESGNGGWVDDVSVAINSWEFGEPTKTIINGAASGTHAWCTNLTDNYQSNENSAVISPCYNFTNLKRPMIILKKWSSSQNGSDGAVLQARIDGVTDWLNIGSLYDGINWYNGVGITGGPGGAQNVGSYGWTGNDTGWVEVRHNLDTLIGYDNVRFRIAFGSDGSSTSDGFAFDDIWIGERSKVALVEHFTNSSDDQCATFNPQVNSILDGNLGDVVDIQYHTSFPGFDQMNEDNPSAPSARSMYYGASTVPWSVVDGTVYSGMSSGFVSDPQIINLRVLEDPLFHIELTTEKSSFGVDIEVTISSQDAISGKNITCQLAVVEKEINSLTGENGETMFRSVLKKMVPNAGGTNFTHDWWDGQSETITATWNYTNVYNPDQVYVVAFVQDENTKEIYQVTSDDTTAVYTGLDDPSIISDVQNTFAIYPNPASEMVNFIFSNENSTERTLEVYDNLGQIIETIIVKPGTKYLKKNLEKYAEGIYLVVLKEEYRIIETRKLVVGY